MFKRLLSSAAISSLCLVGGCSDSSAPPDAPGKATSPASDVSAPPAAQQAEVFDLGDPTGAAAHYRCDDGSEIELTLHQHGASLLIGDQRSQLQQGSAASGSFYQGERWSVHMKDDATLLINSAGTQGCFATGGSELPSIEVESEDNIEDAH